LATPLGFAFRPNEQHRDQAACEHDRADNRMSHRNEFADDRLADHDNHRRQGKAKREHDDDHLARRQMGYRHVR
jgi:hypothetical protein